MKQRIYAKVLVFKDKEVIIGKVKASCLVEVIRYFSVEDGFQETPNGNLIYIDRLDRIQP